MANSWLHLQLHKSLCPGQLGVLKKMTQDLRGEKKDISHEILIYDFKFSNSLLVLIFAY